MEAAPTFEDFLWAYSVFWSRGQSLPMVVPGEAPGNPEAAHGGTAAAADGGSGGGGGRVRVVVQEGVVPGLDFCNHRVQVGARCGAVRCGTMRFAWVEGDGQCCGG